MSSRTSLPPRPAPGQGAGSLPAHPLRVLAFGWEFAPIVSGGLGVACAGLVRAMVAEGADVTFVLPRMPEVLAVEGVTILSAHDIASRSHLAAAVRGCAAAPDDSPGNVAFVRFETPLAPYQSARTYGRTLGAATAARRDGRDAVACSDVPGRPGGTDGAVVFSLYGGNLSAEVERMATAAAAIAAATPHDVIHCHDWMTFAAGVAARAVSGRPLVLHVHSTESDRSGGGGGDANIRAREESGLVAADRVVAVSEFTRRKILQQYSIDPAKLRVVHNGSESRVRDAAGVDLPPLAGLRPIVLFLGRLTVQKGPEWFLDAAARVHRLRPDVLFVVAGDGELLPWMVERAAQLGLAGDMLFTGFLSGADIDRAYAMADVFVMPSVSEPFGLVPIEAMARGTPAIVSRQSGVSEVIRHCLKVDFWDTDDLADKIVGVIDHPSLATSLAGGGLAEAARLGWQEPARKLLDVFAELVPEGTVVKGGFE